MHVTDKIQLLNDKELKLYFFNPDPKFKDFETQFVSAGSEFLIVGYVTDKSNKLFTDDTAKGDSNYACVIKNIANNELFRLEQIMLLEHFVKVQLN